MFRYRLAAAIATTIAVPATGLAQDAAELESIKQQIRQLEERLEQAESKSAAPVTHAQQPDASAAYAGKPAVSNNG